MVQGYFFNRYRPRNKKASPIIVLISPAIANLTSVKLIHMKKVLFFVAFILMASFNMIMAQPPSGGQQMDQSRMLEMMKQRVKPQLIEKTKLTDAQADKVLEIQMGSQGAMRGMRDLSDEERMAKMKSIREENNKKFKEIPLTDDQIKAVNDFYDEMRKNRMQRGGGNN